MAAAGSEPEWLDAQPYLERVCAGMAVGELLHGPSFSLFDATTAIEIGDPKMDMGMHRSEETGSAEELIAAGGAPVDLPPPVLLAVLDRLLCLEATWHGGSMLPQTVFTSLYMLQPERLSANAPLHAFCLALRSACSVFVDMAHAGSVTEDEDLFVHTFGIRMLDLPGPKPVNAALQALAVAEEQLEQRVLGAASSASSSSSKEGKGSSSGGGGKPPSSKTPAGSKSGGKGSGSSSGGGGSGHVAGEGGPTAEQAAALLARIRFRRLLLEALQSLRQYSQAGVEAARKQCQLAEAQLQLVADSASLAAPADQAPSFVPEVNRKHMGLVPPRPVQARSFEQAVEHWRGLLRGLADALHSLLFVRGSWPALKATLVDFASKNNHAIVRSAMHLQLIKPLPPPPAPVSGGAASNGSSSGGSSKAGSSSKKAAAEVPGWCPGQQMVCRELGLSAAAIPSADAALFVEQACIAVQGQVYALCLNRCRQRRRLRRQLEDWKNIFDHGFNADVTPEMQAWLGKAGWRWSDQQEGLLQGQGPAATWAEREAAGCALLHLQLGWPLDLYAPCEFLQLYWYCDYLMECQQRAGSLLHAAAPVPQPTAKRGSPGGWGGAKQRGGRGGGGGSSGPGQQLSAEEQQVAGRELELLLLDVERMMAQAMFRSAIALQQLSCITLPDAPFNTEEQRFEQRFSFMEQLCRPDPVPYAHFAAVTSAQGVPPARVLASAQANFQRAMERAGALLQTPPLRALLREEQARHLETVQRTATQNAVACKLLAATAVKSAAAAAAAAGGGAEQQQQQQSPPFKAGFDFKAALASSGGSFYPVIKLSH